MAGRFHLATLALLAGALVACGTSPTSGSGGPGPGAGSTSGSGTGSDPCSLLTGSEAGGAMHIEALKTVATTGDPAACSYQLPTGEEALVVNVLRNGAESQYKSFVDNGSGEEVDGVGDKALYERSTRRLVFVAGGRFVSVFSRYIGGADAALEATTAMGKIIASRLTTGSVASGLAATPPPVATAKAACDLLSAAEATVALGLGTLKADSNGAPQFCYYSLPSGEVVLSTYLQRTGGSGAWGGLESSLTTDPVSGLGEKAMFEPSTNILFVLKGDSIFNVNVLTVGLEAAAALDQDRKLARIMLTHL